MKIKDSQNWKHTLSNYQQLGGIETSVLDNGAGRGVRIAWINTGTGLRYKVVLDRGMDILDAFHNEHSLAWISHAGLTAPQPFSNQGIDWLRTFGGGLVTTCGLSNAGPPNSDANGSRGLHGNYSNLSSSQIFSLGTWGLRWSEESPKVALLAQVWNSFDGSQEQLDLQRLGYRTKSQIEGMQRPPTCSCIISIAVGH